MLGAIATLVKVARKISAEQITNELPIRADIPFSPWLHGSRFRSPFGRLQGFVPGRFARNSRATSTSALILRTRRRNGSIFLHHRKPERGGGVKETIVNDLENVVPYHQSINEHFD